MEILLFDSFFIRKKQTGNNLFFRIDPQTHTSSHASTSHILPPPHTSSHTSSHATPHITHTSSHRLTHHLTHLHTPPHTSPTHPPTASHITSHIFTTPLPHTSHIFTRRLTHPTPPAWSPGLLFSPSSERPQRSVKKGRLFERSEFLPFSVVQEASRRKK